MIPVQLEPHAEPPYERCCFCRTPTPIWTDLPNRTPGEQVACCDRCAKRAHPQDVPTKAVWCRRERIATPDRQGTRPPTPDEYATIQVEPTKKVRKSVQKTNRLRVTQT